ncbi:PilZ domain-containing protein [Leptospira sp. 96542]|nr:PilZ domain-containing protein [Leptospira sp. 96542]
MAETNKSIFSDSYSMYAGSKQKRKQARVKLNVPCVVKLIASKNTPIEAVLSDLGTGGLSLQSTAIFYTGDQVKIEFSLNQKQTEIIGTVVRTSGKTTTVVFSNLPEEIHSRVQDYIHKHYFDPKTKI